MRWLKRVGLFVVLFQMIPAVAGSIPSSAAAPSDPLPENMQVSDAIETLGAEADQVARAAGSDLEEWKQQADDSAAWIDTKGSLFFVDPPSTAPAAPDAVATATVPYTETFLLHSRPTATRKLFLDFDGRTVAGTNWSATPLVAEPYSIDGDTSTFTAGELDSIQSIWQQVSEDYAPFDIDVTTEDPGLAGINRSSAADVAFGTSVVFTGTDSVYRTVCPGGCGGVAYGGVFDSIGASHDQHQPAWALIDGVGSSAKNLAEVASHEAGHNVGLGHDGTATQAYHTGNAVWSPIMGVSYYRPISQWSVGEYPGASNHEDDFQVIQSNSLPLVADEGGSVASPRPVGASPMSLDGLIGTPADQDAMQFTADAGTVTFSATPALLSPNLDIRLDLLDATGAVVATDNPRAVFVNGSVASGMGASLTATVTAGVYRIVVDGVGQDGSWTTDGYSDYGSVGAYHLTGAWPTSGVNQPPIAAPSVDRTSGFTPMSVRFSSVGSTDIDGTIVSYAWDFGDGTTSSDPNPSKVFETPGTSVVTLTVVDDAGASHTAPITIVADPAPPTLTSGSPIGSLAGVAGTAPRYYVVDVPAGAIKLTVTTSGGTGDVDLYVRRDLAPTTSVADCSSESPITVETCSLSVPTPGRYFVMLVPYADYSGVTLTADVRVPTMLTSGVAVSGLAGAAGSSAYYAIDVPAGLDALAVTTSGGSGDADIYVHTGPDVSRGVSTCSSYGNSNSESCEIVRPAAGRYYILLYAASSRAFSGLTLTARAANLNAPPTAVAAASRLLGPAPLTVTFTSTGSRDPDGTIVSYRWSFSDGSTSSAATLNKRWTVPGTYTATVTVTDNKGASATSTPVTVTVTATNQAPTAVASASVSSGAAPLSVTYNGSGSSDPDGTIKSYRWSFSDGSTSASATVTKRWTNPGTHTATLTVIDDRGAVSVASAVTVTATNQAPTARASVSPATGAAPFTATYDGRGSTDADGTIKAYRWVFSDGATSTARTVTKRWATPGTYSATLTVIDNFGVVSAPSTVSVTATNRAPVAVASASVAGGVAPLAMTFRSTGSADPDGSIRSYRWTFSDGTTSAASSVTKRWTVAGTYTATLTVTDNFGVVSAPSTVSVSVAAPAPVVRPR